MAIPKCKLNVWHPKFGEHVAEEYGIKTAYVGKTCTGKDFSTDRAVEELIGKKEKLFNIKQLGK